jgi:hypothetical protein
LLTEDGIWQQYSEKVCGFKTNISGYLETGGFTLLGWHYGVRNIFPIWFFLHQEWGED